MPRSIGLYEMKVVSPAVEPPEPPKKTGASVNGPSRAAKPGGKAQSIPNVKLELAGVAPTDAAVARFVRRLGELPIFADVDVSYIRPVEVRDLQAREFEITAEIPAHRLELAGGPVEEVTLAQ